MYFGATKQQVFFSWQTLWIWEGDKWLGLRWVLQLCLSHLLTLTTIEAGPFKSYSPDKYAKEQKRDLCSLICHTDKGTDCDFDLVQSSCQVPKYTLKAAH